MRWKTARTFFAAGILALFLLAPNLSRAQTAATILSGTVTDASGKALPNAKISVKNKETGQSIETQADSAGRYSVPNLVPGAYAISVSAEGFDAKVANVDITETKQQNMDLTLNAAPTQQQLPANPSPAPTNPPTAAPSSTTALSLGDLGFASGQTQGSAQQQALLNKRTHMLKVHQTLGLITAIPMAATLISGPQAKAKGKNGQPITEPTSANLDLHIALGGLTTGLYFTTAYYAMFAPKIPGVKPKGAIRVHRDLEWVHGPGMILTPILGIMAYNQEKQGQKVHGLASAHAPVAYVTALAYGASIVAVSWPIHLKLWR